MQSMLLTCTPESLHKIPPSLGCSALVGFTAFPPSWDSVSSWSKVQCSYKTWKTKRQSAVNHKHFEYLLVCSELQQSWWKPWSNTDLASLYEVLKTHHKPYQLCAGFILFSTPYLLVKTYLSTKHYISIFLQLNKLLLQNDRKKVKSTSTTQPLTGPEDINLDYINYAFSVNMSLQSD